MTDYGRLFKTVVTAWQDELNFAKHAVADSCRIDEVASKFIMANQFTKITRLLRRHGLKRPVQVCIQFGSKLVAIANQQVLS